MSFSVRTALVTFGMATSFSAAASAALPVERRANLKPDLCYQIVTDRFNNGDTANDNPSISPGLFDSSQSNWKLYWGGDWKGIQDKLNYLNHLGVSAIWISPPVDNINVAAAYSGVNNAGYHGYWARDFKRPEEHFGSAAGVPQSWTVFQNLVDAAHAQGIKVIIDWAPNHTSPVNAADPSFAENGKLYDDGTLVASYASDPNGYFHHNGNISNWDDRYQTKYMNLADLADLEQVNPFVHQYLRDAMTAWLPFVDGIRLDAVKHMTFGWQRAYADRILHARDLFLMGEWFMSSTSDVLYADGARYANESGASVLDFYMNLSMRQVFGQNGSMWTLENAINKTAQDYKYKENLVTFLDNHDMQRFLSINNSQSRLHLALTFLLTLRGTPCIYYGTEQYLHNDTSGGGDPYNRPMMSSWSESTTAFGLIQKLAALRQTQPALQFGQHQQRWINDDVYIYERRFFDDVVLVAINKSASTPYSISGLFTALPAGSYGDQLNGSLGGFNLTVNGGGSVNTFPLGPQSAMVWSYKSPSAPAQPQIGSAAPVMTRAGNLLTLDGKGFGATQGTSEVRLSSGGNNYVAAVVPGSWSDNHVVVTVPTGVPSGVVQAKVFRGGYSNGYDVMLLADEQVPVTFTVNNAFTNWGDLVYVTGGAYELSNWSTATVSGTNNPILGGAMGPADTYSGWYPSWVETVSLPCGRTVEFKFLKITSSGAVTWEAGSNHAYTTPACGTSTPGTVSVNWQS